MSATQPLTLPDEALARFREVLGADAVLVEEPDRDEYRDPYWFKDDRTYDSSVVLLPSSTEEVQALVRIANELGVALWTSSRGKNLGYGGPSPRVRGSAVVSLVRMNRVIEINPELAYAVVEPGVRWFDLHAALQEAGHDDLLVTIPDLGWGSVVGNSLDNGITYMPYGQDFMAPCGMEVVLADGELVRTGMGAMPDNKTWHLYKRGLGPVLDPLFIQSNYGIVTRMGYWLMRRPEAFAPLFLTVPRDDQLAQAIDILRELRLDGTIRGVPSMYSTLTLAAQFPEIMGEFVADGGVLADEQIQEIADRTGLGRWGMRAAIWGDAPGRRAPRREGEAGLERDRRREGHPRADVHEGRLGRDRRDAGQDPRRHPEPRPHGRHPARTSGTSGSRRSCRSSAPTCATPWTS